MRNDPSQTKINYSDWFERQDRNTQIDIVGPARYKEYINGKKVTSFAKDGRITTIKELGIDRTTRQKVFEEIYKDSAIPHELTEKEINDLYNDKLTDKELQNIFKSRYTHIEIDIVGKMPKKQMQLLFRTYDKLLQEYPVGGKLMSIGVESLSINRLGSYSPSKSAILFDREFINGNVEKIIKDNFGFISTDKENHIYIHEFGHAFDFAVDKNKKNGRHLLLEMINDKFPKIDWQTFARNISEYADKVYEGKPDYNGAELYTEAFTAWKNKTLDINNPYHKLILDFFNDFSL